MTSTPIPGALLRHLDVAVAPTLPDALVSPSSLDVMRELTACLPADLTEFFGLECRLWEDRAEADFLLHVSSARGRQALATLAATLSDGEAAHHQAWTRLHDFAAAWSDPSHVLHDRVAGSWLEFNLADAGADAVRARTPSLFMATYIAGRSGAGRSRDEEGTHGDAWLFDDALPLLLGHDTSEMHRSRLRPVLQALPATAHVFQVGVMMSRASDALRLCVRGLSEAQTLAFLSAIDWPGVAAEVAPLLADAWSLSDSVDLDIDVGLTVHAKIGLECSCLQRPAPHGREPAFLDYLVARGLCTPAKADGLRTWPRGFHERSNPDAWPTELRERARELGGGTVSMFLRWLYHIKLVVQPGVPPLAKAYLAVRQFWPNPATLPQMASTGEAYLSGTASTKRA